MEPVEIKVSRRGRKRKGEIQNVGVEVENGGLVDDKRTRLNSFVGRYVKKEFAGSGFFLGKVVYYDSGLYRVDYEDGDCEDLESGEIRLLLVEKSEMKGGLRVRKKKLDDQVAKKSYLVKDKPINEAVVVEVSLLVETETGGCDDGSTVENESAHVDGVEDSSSDSCELVQDMESSLEAETILVPPPELPPSSGTIGVPEEYVSHLFSVYTFLRSFSIRLFLSPFGLDDFVGSLHSSSPNTLLDAVHTSLLRALGSHLETLASDGGSLRASKCQRGVDWRLLDLLTWPVYLVHYLIVMGHSKRSEWKGFNTDLIDVEYYSLPTGMKLLILQILCDDVLDCAELRAEIDMREEEEVGLDSDVTTTSPLESVPRRVHPRNSKISACKDRDVLKIASESHIINSSVSKGDSEAEDVDMDANSDECRICGMDGTLLCCDGCPSAYHSRCIGVSKVSIPEGSWFCPECVISKISPTATVENSLRGAEMFGTDTYGRLFMAACSHLLVLNASADTESHVRYYNQNDIPNVLQALHSSAEHTAIYSGLCKTIMQYWKIPETTLALPEQVERRVEAPVENIGSVCPTVSPHPSGMESHNARQSVVEGILDSSVSDVEKVATISNNTLALMTQTEVSCLHQSGDATLDLTNQRLSDMSFEDFARSSTNSNISINRQGISTVVPAKMLSRTREDCNGIGGRNVSHDCLYTGSMFKSFSYFNNYSHGEFAASAAASLAIVMSEEKVSEDRASDNSRKFIAANIALQVKSFSSIANRFFWPYFERKHGEVPRERCGWCLACKSPPSNKKGCLLNSAALNAIRNAMKILAKLCPIKSGVGNLPKIATYMLYMEESLRGLTVGPFLSATYRRNWQKQVKEASAVNELKSLLLELEENIRPIALSADWVKLVDNRPNEASAAHNAPTSVGQTQKRTQGRPGTSKKQRVDSGPIEASPAQNALSSVGQTQKRGPGRPAQKQRVDSGPIEASPAQNALSSVGQTQKRGPGRPAQKERVDSGPIEASPAQNALSSVGQTQKRRPGRPAQKQPVDSGPIEASPAQNALSSVGQTQKRGPGRPAQKQRVDSGPIEASPAQNALSSVGQTQKRGPGRPAQKQRVDSGPIEASPAQNALSSVGETQKRRPGRPAQKQPVDSGPIEASPAQNALSSVGETQKRRPGRPAQKQPVDSGPIEASPAQNALSSVGQTQKRGPGRPAQKQPAVSKVISGGCEDKSDDICWWRGSKQSESIFQKATLPLSIVKKAARIGGKRKILGVDYAEGSDIPRRSTQLIWRAAVEMSKNVSQLALQVRYLDFHVKWSDLSRSEQTVQEGKGGAETEASAFRNALICDKKVTDKKIMYGLAFSNQKHLPSRVMKNIIVAEQDEEGKDKFWFDEMRIPLYLIKEYEEKAEKASLPSDHKPPNSLSKLQKRQLKASRKDAFAYLVRRRDKWDKCSCASCQLDVILGNAVKCGACEGYCHQSCTINSTAHSNVGIQLSITCKRCYDVNTLRQKEIANSSPTTPLPLQASVYQKAGTITTSAKLKGRNQFLASSVTKGSASVIKQATTSSSKKNRNNIRCWGIIYKKKKGELQEVEDNGVYFRLHNILQRGDPAAHLSKPCCYLCQKPYNPDLTYIHCGHCNHWYHGDAVELEDSRIPEVVGFKCFKCRRQKSPECPFKDKLEGTNQPLKDSKQAMDPMSQIKTKKLIVRGPMNPMYPKKEEPDSFSRDNTITNDKAELGSDCGNVSGIGLQKLPVRRQMKREDDTDGIVGNNHQSHVELPSPLESNGLLGHTNDASSPVIDWDVSLNGFEDETKFDIQGFESGDMEFEPQTYFSFNELMASEDEGGMDKNDASVGLVGNMDTLSPFTNEEFFGTYELDRLMDDEQAGAGACKMCSHNEPAPDLFCQTCCLLIHSHCSPWVEDPSFGEDNWKCGSCREWQ